MVGGALLGLFDGLRAVDRPPGLFDWRSTFALLLSTLLWGAFGAIVLPNVLRLVGIKDVSEYHDPRRRLWTCSLLDLIAIAAVLSWIAVAVAQSWLIADR